MMGPKGIPIVEERLDYGNILEDPNKEGKASIA